MRKLQVEFVEQESETGLVGSLQSLLADSFVFYLRAHGHHWNVEGEAFGPFHALFEGIAGEVYGTLDTMAEHIRKLGSYAPYTLTLFQSARTLPETSLPNSEPIGMVKDLLSGNDDLIARIKWCFKLAESANEQGLMNYLAEREDAHKKHGWFLRATLK